MKQKLLRINLTMIHWFMVKIKTEAKSENTKSIEDDIIDHLVC